MKSTISTKNINAMFLAAILVAGTITAFFPSFMVGTAQAAPYPDIDREKKADKKSVSVSSLKCNNINVNVNGLELSVLPPFLGGGEVTAEAAEDNSGGNSFAAGNNGADGSEINNFRFICINNNNNTVIGVEEPIPPTPPEPLTCEECFTENLPIEVIDNIGGTFGIDGLGEVCDMLTNASAPLVPNELKIEIVTSVLEEAGANEIQISAVLDCLEDIGLIIRLS